MRSTIINRRFRYTYSNVTTILVVINFIVFCLTRFLMPSLTYYLALVPRYILYRHWYWQFLTYMFVHGSVSHFLFNMLSLYIFGSAVERRIGSREFTLYYLLCGTLCGVASYAMYYLANTNVVLLGASGAIYALLILFSALYPSAVIYVFGIIPVQAPLLIIIYFVKTEIEISSVRLYFLIFLSFSLLILNYVTFTYKNTKLILSDILTLKFQYLIVFILLSKE